MGIGSRISCLRSPLCGISKERSRVAVVIINFRLNYWPVDSHMSRDVATVAVPLRGT